MVRIELDVYSGRPNPTFQLSPEAGAELAQKLRSLPASQREPPEPGLGYRGFVVTFENTAAAGVPGSARIFDGLVIVNDRVAYSDVHGAEDWLKQQARQAGYGPLVP
jgi:hypothetical protein